MAGSSSSDSFSSSTGGERRLTVTVETTDGFVVNRDTGYRVRAVVTAEGMTADVFRYQMAPVTGANPPAVKYDGVCSPTDLTAFPVGDPLPDAFPPFCRRDTVDLVFRSTAEADDMIATLRQELQTLVDSLNRLDLLVVREVMVFQ